MAKENEKRLIDANAIKMFLEVVRQDYLEEDTFNSDFAAKMIETVQDEYLANAPSVDAVEVIRCKKCEQSREWGNEGTLLCYRDETTVHIVKPEGYCDGSRRRYAADDPEVLKFAPVVHGRWVFMGTWEECSVCGLAKDVDSEQTNYCPNCGAKMDGERSVKE